MAIALQNPAPNTQPIVETHGLAYAYDMKSINATNARTNLYNLIDDVNSSSEPIKITGARGNAVLVSEEQWEGIQETLYLLSIPGMLDSLTKARNESLEDCATEIEW